MMIVSGNRDWNMRPIVWAGKDISMDLPIVAVVYNQTSGLCHRPVGPPTPSAWGAVSIQRCRCLMVVDSINWLNQVPRQAVAITEMVVLGKKI